MTAPSIDFGPAEMHTWWRLYLERTAKEIAHLGPAHPDVIGRLYREVDLYQCASVLYSTKGPGRRCQSYAGHTDDHEWGPGSALAPLIKAARAVPPPGYATAYAGYPGPTAGDAIIEWSEYDGGPKSEAEAIAAAWQHYDYIRGIGR